MKKFFVIGNKASESLSPLIFNYWFKKYKIKAKYSFVEVSKSEFDKVLTKKIKDKKIKGFNVTIPYKKTIIKHLEIKDVHAQRIGAVNCVTLGKKTKGSNTDWIGYLRSLRHVKINKRKNILIFGCGGASQAIVYGLLSKGFNNIFIFNRTKKIINHNNIKIYTKSYSVIGKHLEKAQLIINTTPTNPLNKQQTKLINEGVVVSDIVYRPKQTTFLNNFNKNKKIYGISMLIEQAIPCFFSWFGFKPVVDEGLIKKLNLKIK